MYRDNKIDTQYADFMRDNYPDIIPCNTCYYYRFLDGSEPYRKRKKYNQNEFRSPACHYSLETGHIKDYVPYNGTCPYYIPQMKSHKYYPFKVDQAAERKKFKAKVDEFNEGKEDK